MKNLIWLGVLSFAVSLACVPAWSRLPAQTISRPVQKTAQKTTRIAAASQNAIDAEDQIFAVVNAIDDVPVPAQESGPISKVLLKEGETVEEGQLMVEMDSTTAALEHEAAVSAFQAAQAKAEDPTEIEFAQASLDLAIAELEPKLLINQKKSGAITDSEVRKYRFAKTKAEKGVQAAMTAREIARKSALVEQAKVSVAKTKLKQLQISSPLSGVISTMFAQKGAWVNAGDPVAQVTRMDRLQVDFRLPTRKYDPSELIGRKTTVELELAGGRREKFAGAITMIGAISQKDHYLAKCEIENRQEKSQWLLRPGVSVEVVVAPK
jgi:multidrug efflux pump subunit AcrA (membrane-fusion protein)